MTSRACRKNPFQPENWSRTQAEVIATKRLAAGLTPTEHRRWRELIEAHSRAKAARIMFGAAS